MHTFAKTKESPVYRLLKAHLRILYFALYKCTRYYYYYLLLLLFHVLRSKVDDKLYLWSIVPYITINSAPIQLGPKMRLSCLGAVLTSTSYRWPTGLASSYSTGWCGCSDELWSFNTSNINSL